MVRIYGLFISEYFCFREKRSPVGRLPCDLPGSGSRAGGGGWTGRWGHWVGNLERAHRQRRAQVDVVIWSHAGVSARAALESRLAGEAEAKLKPGMGAEGKAEDLLISPGWDLEITLTSGLVAVLEIQIKKEPVLAWSGVP